MLKKLEKDRNMLWQLLRLCKEGRRFHEDKETRTEIFGTNEDYMETISANIVHGRFFTKNEDRSGARVTVIGQGIKEAFFRNQDPIGEYIKIDNIKFRVIGVLEKQGKFLGFFQR